MSDLLKLTQYVERDLLGIVSAWRFSEHQGDPVMSTVEMREGDTLESMAPRLAALMDEGTLLPAPDLPAGASAAFRGPWVTGARVVDWSTRQWVTRFSVMSK